jgi:hypothetical protein
MPTFLDMVAANFTPPRPLAPHEPGRPEPEPPPEVQLSTTAVVFRGAEPPAWVSPNEMPEILASRRQLEEAEANLAKLRKDIDLARAASSSRPVGPEELLRYLKDGRAPGRDKDAAAAGERARALEQLVGPAKEAVEVARAGGAAAWDEVPARVWAAAEAEWKTLALEVARTLAAASLAQLALRAFAERYAEFLRANRLPAAAGVPAGFDPPGRPAERGAFDCLLLPTAPRPVNHVIVFLEQLRRAGLLTYEGFDLRPLDWARSTDSALLRMHDVLREVAGQPRPEPGPEPKKGE